MQRLSNKCRCLWSRKSYRRHVSCIHPIYEYVVRSIGYPLFIPSSHRSTASTNVSTVACVCQVNAFCNRFKIQPHHLFREILRVKYSQKPQLSASHEIVSEFSFSFYILLTIPRILLFSSSRERNIADRNHYASHLRIQINRLPLLEGAKINSYYLVNVIQRTGVSITC